MRGVIARPGSTRPSFIEYPEPPSPGEGEVLCRTLELGVCGTDREVLESAEPLVPEDADYLILGHECLARVEQIGAGVENVSAGDLVVPMVRRPRQGSSQHRVDMLAFGEYTERGIVHEHGFSVPLWLDRPEYLFLVDDELAPVAVLTEPLSVAEKAVNEALLIQQARLGEATWIDPLPRVLVTGMGTIGFTALLACRARGWPVEMYGRDPEESPRVRLATAFGATYRPAERNDLVPENVERDGYDLILECTGDDELIVRASHALASRGASVWLGSSRKPQPREHNLDVLVREGLLRNHVHIGSVNSAPRDFLDSMEHLRQIYRTQPADLEALITARVPPEESLPYYDGSAPRGIKTVLRFPQ